MYVAGTGALKTAFTRSGKQSVFAFLDDAAKSAQRFYINNFQDKGRYVLGNQSLLIVLLIWCESGKKQLSCYSVVE